MSKVLSKGRYAVRSAPQNFEINTLKDGHSARLAISVGTEFYLSVQFDRIIPGNLLTRVKFDDGSLAMFKGDLTQNPIKDLEIEKIK